MFDTLTGRALHTGPNGLASVWLHDDGPRVRLTPAAEQIGQHADTFTAPDAVRLSVDFTSCGAWIDHNATEHCTCGKPASHT